MAGRNGSSVPAMATGHPVGRAVAEVADREATGRLGAGGLGVGGDVRVDGGVRAGGPVVGGGGVPGRERLGEIQRARILAAMTELVRERGVSAVTVAHVVSRSGVSRRTFYDLFEDREDGLLAVFGQALERTAAVVIPAYRAAVEERGGVWEERIRAGLGALLEFFDEEPALGGLCVVDALAAERSVLERRARVVKTLIEMVHQGGAALGDKRSREANAAGAPSVGSRPQRIVAEGVVGAVLAVIYARLCESSPRPLIGLQNKLMSIIVLPYRGSEVAALELGRPTPRARKRSVARSDPLRELDMRLTYRTVRVLLAISQLSERGASPSSREVADASDVSDQGQISKLLWRLEHLGLIANSSHQHQRGEPNAWALTPKGREVEQAVHAKAGH
jgi:AcrR family transcriptional regulator